MSRSRKMLNLVVRGGEEVESRVHSSSNSNIYVKESANAVGNVDDNGRTQQTSPLPCGAEEISQELAGIWEEVLHEDGEAKSIICNSSIPNVMTNLSTEEAHSNQSNTELICDSSTSNVMFNPSTEEVYSNQPSIFSLEAPSSFENSPLIQLEELLEASHHRSTPVSELSVPTPMPSPTNVHSICDSIFCPSHEDSSITSPATSYTSDGSLPPKRGRKRQKRPNEWSDVKRKCLTNLGKKYISKQGKAVDEKTMGPPCKCRYNCSDKISHQQRLECFTKFWQLGDRGMQWNFVIKYSDKMNKKRCLNQEIPNKRKFTFKYYLPLITGPIDSQCHRIEVCQTMFINTLSVSPRIIKTAWNKYDGSAIIEKDSYDIRLIDNIVKTDCYVI